MKYIFIWIIVSLLITCACYYCRSTGDRELAAVFMGQDKKQSYSICRTLVAGNISRLYRPLIANSSTISSDISNIENAETRFGDFVIADVWQAYLPEKVTIFGSCQRSLVLKFDDGKVVCSCIKYSSGGELPTFVPYACGIWSALAVVIGFTFTMISKFIAKKKPIILAYSRWALYSGIILCWVVIPLQSYQAANMLLYENAFLIIVTIIMLMSLLMLRDKS